MNEAKNRTTEVDKTEDGLFYAKFGDSRYDGDGLSLAETKEGLLDIWIGGCCQEKITKEQVKALLPYLQSFGESE